MIHKAPVPFDGKRKWVSSNIITIRKIFDKKRRELTHIMLAVNIKKCHIVLLVLLLATDG